MSTHGTAVVMQASTSNAVGATTTSSALDGNNAYMGEQGITAKITNGATGPTVGCTATVNISDDNSTWHFFASQTAPIAANGIYPLIFEPPRWARYAQITFGGNTGQAVTVEAQGMQLTGA